MRKIIAICGVVMLAIFTSVFFAACGNDYKDMYLVIEYLECTETQNGVVGNWKEIDASDGLSFVLDDKYKIDSQNYYSLRCRVTVKGTKKKVDEISVSATGSASLQLSDTKIDENGEFTIKVFTTGSANVFVVPNIQSDKTAVEFPINLYNEVESISQNPEFYPAVAKGGELKLNELQDVICYFGANGGDTNQAGVAYSIPGVQNVDGVYTLGDTNGSSYFVLNTSNSLNPTISVGTDFDQDEVVLKATSVYSEKTSANKVIDCDISVKIVENIAPTDININFASNYSESENTNRLNKIKEFSLFAQSENFRQSNLVLSGICEDSNYSFFTEELKAQGAIGYSVDIFIDGENINDEGNLEYYHGLKFTDVAIDDTIKANGNILSKQKNKMWTIEATDYILSSVNTIKFVIGFENLKFTGKDYNLETSVLQYEIKVNREDLPKAVSINDNPYKDGHVIEKNIYTEYVNGSGLALNVKAVRTLEKQTEILMQTYTNAQDKTYGEFNNLNVYNFNGTPVNFDSNRSSYILNNFSNSVYIKFDNSIGKYAQTVYVDFKVLASPSVFEGVAVADKEYIVITLKLNVVGSLEGVKLTSDVAGNNNNLFAESYKYLETETTYVSYLSLSANGSASVDTTELTIKSKNSTILFSADNTNWNTVLNCGEIEQNKLYYKGSLTPKGKSDKIIIEAINGVVFESASIEFVETVGGNSLTLAYANNFIYQAKTTDAYYTENLGTEETPNNKNYAGYYLAIQLGTDADFYFGYGDEFSENYGIYDVNVKNLTVAQLAELGKTLPYYGVGAVEVKEFTNNYSFNIYAQTSNLTCVLEVNVIYFKNSGFLIEKVQDRVYLEIAVYTPVSRLTITPSEANTTNEIYYVNSIINDKSSAELTLAVNSNASTKIYFSDSELTNSLNSSKTNNKGYMYSISVINDAADVVDNGIVVGGLIKGSNYVDLATMQYNVSLTKHLSINKIDIKFIIEELGYTRTINHTLDVVDFTKVKDIIISRTTSNNVDLSLQSEDDRKDYFIAEISNFTEATYPILDYQVFEYDEDNVEGNYLGDGINIATDLKVEIDNEAHKVNLKAISSKGGKFVVKIVSPDSFNDAIREYELYKYVVVTISDGTEENPYYLRDDKDVENIKDALDKHYVMASNIDLVKLKSAISGEFTGSINGILNVHDLEKGMVYHTQYEFRNLNINSNFNNAISGNDVCYSLFASNSGVLKNLVFKSVRINLNIETGTSNNSLNISVIVGKNKGEIINCSVQLLDSNIVINGNNESNYKEYNIGLIASDNIGKINFYTKETSNLKKYSTNLQTVEIQNLKIALESLSNSALINVGGISGTNNGTITANYFENKNKYLREYLTGEVNFDITNQLTENLNYNLNVGGATGLNNKTVSQVALTGNIKVLGNNYAVGGLVGKANSGSVLQNSACYSLGVNGEVYKTQTSITNQYVGGVVGSLVGTVENVYSLFVDLSKLGLSSYKSATVSGVDVVGGIVGHLVDGKLEFANVQSFEDRFVIIGNFSGIDSTKQIGGLVGLQESGTTISESYVKADIKSNDATNIYNLTSGTISNSYYIGQIEVYKTDSETKKLKKVYIDTVIGKDLTINSSNDVYSLINGYEISKIIETDINGTPTNLNYIYEYGKLFINGAVKSYYNKFNEEEKWLNSAPVIDNEGKLNIQSGTLNGALSLFGNFSSSIWDKTEYYVYNNGLPVIMNNQTPTLLAIANELVANVSDSEFKVEEDTTEPIVYANNNGIYIANKNHNTAIVFLSDKTYNLVKENKNSEGLIDKTIYPVIASGEYYVNVLSGIENIHLVGNSIRFKKIGKVEIEFISIFNANAKDKVVIFIENPVNNFEAVKNGKSYNSILTYTNTTELIEFNALFNNKLSLISTENLYFDVKLSSNDEDLDVSNNDYLVVESLDTDSLKEFGFNNLQLRTKSISSARQEFELTISLYLNLNKYIYENSVSLHDLFGDNVVKIAEKTITIIVYQNASELVINSFNQTMGAGDHLSVEFEIKTDYLNLSDSELANVTFVSTNNNYLYTTIEGKESFYAVIESNSEYFNELSSNSLWSLFDYSASYKLNSSKTGYVYYFNLELKEEYKTIDINHAFNITFVSISNDNMRDSIRITYLPQAIKNIRVESFKNGVATLSGNNEVVEYHSDETHSSIIVPGKSGLLKLYIEPSYALADVVEVATKPVRIAGRDYVIEFQQMLYDVRKGYYVAYSYHANENNALKLDKFSYIDENGNKVYSGIIYVRTYLMNVNGASETFEVKLNIYNYERDADGNYNKSSTPKLVASQRKFLLTQYNPGVTLSVKNALTGKIGNGNNSTQVYLIEKTSNNVRVYARIYGYEINQQPSISLSWLKEDDVNDIARYVNISQGSVIEDNGAYLVEFVLKTSNLDKPFVFKMSLSLAGEGEIIESEEKTITFYPVEYIPTKVYLRGSSNDNVRVAVNSSYYFELVWLSENQSLNSSEINSKLFDENGNVLQYFYTTYYDTYGRLIDDYLQIHEYDNYSINKNTENKLYYLTALGEDFETINFYARYDYVYNAETDSFEIVFKPKTSGAMGYSISYTFSLDLSVLTSEETPDAIYSAEQLKDMKTGGNYILMNDITLEHWTPISTEIASLDGNGKVISIKSFNVATSSTEIIGGLFATISENTILKNIVIDVGSYEGTNGDKVVLLADENSTATATHFGFLAGINNGIIYNSEIISLNKDISINVETSTKTANIATFVGKNNGNIINSRVGTEFFEKISVNNENGATTSSTIQAKSITLTGKGIMAGFVAQNSGVISSSYFKNSNIINESAVVDDIYNKTAGFVAVNSGRVLNSYTKGNGVSATNYRGKDSQISATKAGSSAGFVFDNSGTIENSYSNILVSSYSGGVAGFVYRNNANGVINQSYSASVVNASDLSVSTVLPFVGVGIDGTETNKLLSNGKLNNCYYLQLKTDNFDEGYEYSANMDMPYALNDVSFADPDNLLNFAFVEGGYNESIHGVWTYYQILNKGSQNNLGRTILPELTSANQISRSVRYLKLTNDRHELFYANDYGLGSENNPYIIRNADEYNAIFAISSNLKENSFAGSIRFVNDIDFAIQTNNDVATINTTLGYTLGDIKQNTLTVIDGNGMKISSVNTRNNQNSLQTSLGLFNKIEYSIIKNLDIYYEDMPYTSTSATYSGGLAGKINNSSIINLDLIGNNTTITARNFAGGLAGVISGDSAVYNVNSNLSVEAGYEELTTNYYQYINFENFKTYANSLNFDYSSSKLNIEAKYEEYISKLSYAGGLAAIIDIGSGEEYSSTFNLNKITIGQSGTTTVTADIAGFVAGYLSRTSFANRITARINNSSFVFGSYISAGFIAENYGKIRYSEVVASETNQTNFDKAFGEYIVAEKTLNTTTALNNANNSYGNLSFVRAETDKDNLQNISAGFVGVNYGGSIDNSYTKANISANSSLIGGFVGVNYGGSYESVYAQNYIDLNSIKTNANRKASIGGFIAKNALSVSNGLSLVYNLVHKENTNLKVDSVVIATFYDKSQINNLTKTNNKNIDIDYLIAQSENKINSSLGDTSAPMNVYYLSYEGLAGSCYNNDIIIKDSPLETKKLISKSTILSNDDEDFDIKAEAKPIDTLYDIDSNDKEQDEKQLTLFTTLFMSFDINVWDKSDNKKFFPVLKENPILNYYEINEEQDLLLIILHPDANFVLTGDIALTSERVDYVLDVVFSGTLVGRIDEEGNAPTISGIKLTTSNATKTAGFFRSTNGATINNINLSYSYLLVNNSNGKSYVGLLSAEDKSSIVTSVNIYTHNSDDRVNDVVIQNDCYVMTKEGVHVSNFGGLFGVSTSCQITASHVSANVSLNAGKIVDDETQRGALGGLVGYLSGANASIVDAMILNSSYIGDIYATSYINVGGLVGYSENASLTNSKIDASLNLISSSNFYAGGVIGKQVNSYIEEALANVKVIIANESEASASYYVGGISGYVSNSSSSKSADIIGGKAVFNISSNDKVSTLIIGGIVASTQGYAKIENSISWIFSEDGITATNMVLFGGIVGNSIGNLIYIDNCFAYIESSNAISHEGLTISCKNITAGGFIGSINSNAIVIDIMNSSATGAIWPKYDGADGRLILGGMIASIENVDFSKTIGDNVYKTQIVNSFTTVAFETSQYKVNNNDKTILDSQTSSFVVSSIISLVGANCAGKIYIKDCYYSSDYTLCLEEKTNIFDGAVINLLPQSLLAKDQKDYFFKDGWTSKDFGLPYRTDLVEGMTSMIYGNSSLFKLFTTSGTSLKPKVIDKEYIEAKMSGELFEDSYYNYYVFDWVVDWNNLEPEYTSKLLTGDLNGFVLGNGLEISVKESLDNILTNSVISNLKISIIDVENVLNEKALIIKNSGTIFNVYLDYYLVDDEVSFTSASAGLVKRNNGNILYCVNSGTIEITGANFAGMVYTNSGYIANSAYIGSVVSEAGSNVAGLVIENIGSIYNSYSAGVVAKGQSTFVKSNSAVIRNSYYDKYANQEFANIVDSGKGTTYLKAVSTYELQTIVSGLKGNWDIYPLNAKQAKTGEDGLELKDKDGNIIYKTHTEFYNYGYPIYSIHQTYYDTTFDNDTVKTYIYKGLFTGSGTETAPYQIPNLGVLESINSYNNTANLYFMIINDIDFNKNNKNNSNATNLGFAKDWFGVGEVGNSSEWVKEGKNNAFSGTIYSGLRNGEFEEYSRVIANITGKSGLINKMSSDAEIHNLILSGSEIKNNSGNVGLVANSFVKSTNNDQRELENGNVYNINIIDGIEFNLAGTNVGGLIGSVEYEANINNIALDSASINVMASNAGGLVGVINGESITGNTIFTNITSNFTISGKSTNLGSFIGLANKSAVFTEITVGSQVVGINKDSDDEGADINVSEAETVGGFVGTIDQNSEITMINVKIAEEGDEAGVTVGGKSAVGGLVGNLFGTLTLESKFEINKFNLDIFTNSNINDSYAGGLIGKLGVNTETESVIGLLNIKLGENEEVGETYEATISIGENEKSFPSYSGGVVGGFFNGEIYTNSLLNLEISNLKATKYAGGVASIMKAGNFCGINLNFVEASESGAENITDNLIAPVFGGIVGQMLGGEIGKIEETNNATKEELLLVKVEGSLKVANALVLASCVGEYQGGIIKNFETDLSNVSSLKNDDLDVKFNPTNKGISALIAVSLADVVVLGNVKISNSLIVEGGNDVENIGAFFGFITSSTIQTLKDSSLEIDKVNVNGIKNVGGFAGQFVGTTSLNLTVSEEGETNTVKEYLAGKKFAVIGIPSDDILNIGNMENIGGLFGYYNSNSEMLFNVNGEDEPSQFVNANTVLVDAFTNNQSKNSEKFNLSESTNYSIINIGGVVGNTASTLVGGLNQANIGTGYADSYYNALFEDFKNNKNKTILNAKNVGGVVGTISSDKALIKIQNAENSKDDEFIIVGYQNVGGIIGNLKPINQEKYQLLNVLNHGLVYGYNNVGGIIGSANANIEAISIKNPDGGENNLTIENQGNVFGFSNVGGFAGELKEVSSNLGAMMLEAEVEGVINVGGVVGYTNTNLIIYGNTVDITGDYSGVVRGNSNVGGIVGKSEYVSGNGYVQSEETLKISLFNSNNITIEVQEYKYGKNKVDSKDAYYMPTSVGGVAGYAKTISLSGNFGGTIKNSENELMATSSSLANYIISKNSNSFASLVNSDKRDIDSTQSGIGGMVGTFEEYVTENTSIESATLKFNINVSNGINVGGLFGYWYAEIENVVTDDGVIKNAVTLPLAKVGGVDESNRIYVAGGVNIGGIAGKITTNSGAIATSLDLTYCNFELDYLTLQEGKVFKSGEEQSSAIFGENVGGLFGSTDVALSNIVIENNNKNLGNLRINNTEGDNFGVIVGKTSSDITGVSINSAVLKYSETGNNSGTIFKHPTNFNYGAIAGMVDVKSEKIEIHGVHHGAFTINTLRNFNYDISNKDLAVDHDMSQILLTGYGTNNAEISISPSNEKINNNPSIYDSSKPETITGWHQEYTMFNVIKLASTNEDNEIVSSLPIYNSENISRVQLIDDEDEDTVVNNILFTIYGDLLYSRVGIAKLYNNLYTDVSDITSSNTHETFLKSKYNEYNNGILDNLKDKKTEIKVYEYSINSSGNLVEFVNSNATNEKVEEAFNDDTGALADIMANHLLVDDLIYTKDYGTLGGKDHTPIIKDVEYPFYNFRSEQALAIYLEEVGLGEDKNQSFLDAFHLDLYFCAIKTGDNYFYYKFETIFADCPNEEYEVSDKSGKEGEEITTWNQNLKYTSRSWSLFDIQGSTTNRVPDGINSNFIAWGSVIRNTLLSIVVLAAVIGAIFISGGSILVGVLIILGSGVVLIATLATMLDGAFFMLNEKDRLKLVAQQNAKNYITTTYEGNLGYISNSYVLTWEFEKGYVKLEYDTLEAFEVDVIQTNGTKYADKKLINYRYYSTTKPVKYGEYFTYTQGDMPQSNDVYTPKNNEQMPIYQYKDGLYYICSWYMEEGFDYEPLQIPLDISDPIGYKYVENEGYYVIKNEEWLKNNNLSIHNVSDKTTKVGLSYKYLDGVANTGAVEGYHYIIKSYSEIGLKYVSVADYEESENTIRVYDNNGRLSLTGSTLKGYLTPIDSNGNMISGVGVPIDQVSSDDYGAVVRLSYEETNDIPTIILEHSSTGTYIQEATYYFYNSTPVGFEIREFDGEDKLLKELTEREMEFTNVVVAHAGAAPVTTRLNDLFKTMNSNPNVDPNLTVPQEIKATWDNTYLINPDEVDNPDDYKISNYFYLEISVDGAGNYVCKIYEYNYSYVVTTGKDGEKLLNKVTLKLPEGENYEENRSSEIELVYDGVSIFVQTRYDFSKGTWVSDPGEILGNAGLMPLYNGWTGKIFDKGKVLEYQLSETVMISFNNSPKNKDAGIICYIP